ncbi:MAG: pyridoxamine 5'-phosphate oxidase family protein [Thiovulaceae bacterium]|nr:pyridoxamine 5'-phosphate oxidase family protein [Sulfurimonadaceae bacterium]
MSESLERIEKFLQKHHVLTLATCAEGEVSACSLFYAYDATCQRFIVASADETTHIRHILQNPRVAGNIPLETKIVGKIQGVQFRGLFAHAKEEARTIYFKRFPYALAMQPKLWEIKVDFFKMSDNTLGFGEKVIWQETSL